jgi:aspartate/tyrosine/aromatic aminotransferase
MIIYQHKHTKVLMSENDYNHLSTREKNEMVLLENCTFNPNKISKTENEFVDVIIGVNGKTRIKNETYGGNK